MATAAPKRPTRRTSTKATKPAPAAEPEVEDLELDDVEEAPAPKRTTRRTKAAAKPAPEPVEEDDDELEDVAEDADEDEDEAPAKPKAKKIEHGSQWLAEYVNEQCGTEHSAYTLRALIRKLVKEGKYERAVGTDRSRYEYTGPSDPKVKAIIAAIKAGADKKNTDRADNLKKAREAKAKKAAEKAKSAPAEEVEELDEEIEDLDEEIEEIDDLDED